MRQIYAILLLIGLICETVLPSSEKRLIKQLIDNYEKAGKIGRPVKNTKDRVVVGYGLSLFQLLDLDEKNQVLTVNVWTKYTWTDQLLRWNPANYSNIREVRIPPRVIWTPDIVLYNYADERLKEQRDVMLNVDYMGRVFWSPPAIFKSNCHIDIRNFPFDHQYCFLKFASWTYNSEQLDLQFLDNRTEVDMDQYTSNNEWSIVARPAYRFIMLSEECGKEIPDLTFFLFLKRNPAFYGYLLVFPCVLLSVITTVIFWLPPQIPAKMLLSMNIFVAFSLLLKILASSTPSASTIIPFLGYYYCLNMILLSFSTFVSTIIVNRHFQRVKTKYVPPWLANVVFLLAKPLHVSKVKAEVEPSKRLSVLESQIREAKSKQQQQQQQLQPNPDLKSWPIMAGNPNNNNPNAPNPMFPQFPNQMAANMMFPFGRYPEIQNREAYYRYLMYMQQNCMLPPNMPPMRPVADYQARPQEEVWNQQQSTPASMTNNQQVPFIGLEGLTNQWNSNTKPVNQPIEPNLRMARRSTLQLQFDLGDLRNALKNLMAKIAKKDEYAKRASEWRLVLITLDRLFFWFYLAAVITAGIYLLFPRGMSHTPEEIKQLQLLIYKKRNAAIIKQCAQLNQTIDKKFDYYVM